MCGSGKDDSRRCTRATACGEGRAVAHTAAAAADAPMRTHAHVNHICAIGVCTGTMKRRVLEHDDRGRCGRTRCSHPRRLCRRIRSLVIHRPAKGICAALCEGVVTRRLNPMRRRCTRRPRQRRRYVPLCLCIFVTPPRPPPLPLRGIVRCVVCRIVSTPLPPLLLLTPLRCGQ